MEPGTLSWEISSKRKYCETTTPVTNIIRLYEYSLLYCAIHPCSYLYQRWIKKANYRKRHMVDSEDDELPPKKVCRVTTWMQFLQTFASTDGKSS